MNNFFLTIKVVTSILILSFAGSNFSLAQESSEQFIPIGKSPGISHKASYIGKIISVNEADYSLVVKNKQGSKIIKVTSATRIWLDRTKKKKANTSATFADCNAGSLIEVKLINNDNGIADWIKIESS